MLAVLKSIQIHILLCWIFQSAGLYAQNPPPDSLLKKADRIFNTHPQLAMDYVRQVYNDAVKSNKILPELKSIKLLSYFYYQNRDFNNARYFAALGLKKSEKCSIDSLTGDFWSLNGVIDQIENRYQEAITGYQRALFYYDKRKLASRIGNTYQNIGVCNMQLSRFQAANYYYFKSTDIFTRLSDMADLADTYNSIGICFLSLTNYKKALEYERKSLSLRSRQGDKGLIAQSYNNIGLVYLDYSKPDSAINYLSKSIALYQRGADSSLIVLPLQNLGWSWKMKNNLIKAGNYIDRSLKIASNYGMKEDLARGSLDLAEVLRAEKKYDAALNAIKITINTAQTLKLPELLMNAFSTKAGIYTQMHDYKNALFYENKRNEIKDSLFTVAKNKAVNELEVKYQTNEKERDIAALHVQNQLTGKVVTQQKRFIIVLIIAAFLLLLLLIILYNNFRIKNEANRRIQTLMQDLHHRVKNNLQVLSSLFSLQIENLTDEKTKNALRENEARLTAMNLIHNKLYFDHTTTTIEMQEYLTKLLQHIKVSFGGEHVNLNINVAPVMLEADKAVAIGLIINELATNAFKYAFDGNEGEISLSLKQEGKSKILLALRDNGKGISGVHKKHETSFGLKLVNLMVRQLGAGMHTQNDNGAVYQFEISL